MDARQLKFFLAVIDYGGFSRAAEQLTYLTRYMRLGPGDVVLTGCPGTVAPVKPGDQAVVAIDGIGELSNPVRTQG
jgi:2-keto-4-pentenoate hydratase/2-oxohepta-3-ene-1,7-dioic acid hydratase in catechol pathway